MKRKRGNKNQISPIIIGVIIFVVLVIGVIIYFSIKTSMKLGPPVSEPVFNVGQACNIAEFGKCWNPQKNVNHPYLGPDMCGSGMDGSGMDENKIIKYKYSCVNNKCKKERQFVENCKSLASVAKPFCNFNDERSICNYNGKCVENVEKNNRAECEAECKNCGINK